MDTTSSKERQQQSHDQDFISHEMSVTKEAISKTASEMWDLVPKTDDIAAWTKANPMLAVGVAAGAGVLAGFMVAPGRAPRYRREQGGGHSVLGSLVGAVMPALSTAMTEAGRTALSAAVAHFTSQHVAEETAEQTAEETVNENTANGFYAGSPSSAEAA